VVVVVVVVVVEVLANLLVKEKTVAFKGTVFTKIGHWALVTTSTIHSTLFQPF
jgi:hypothetical protein